MGTISVGVILSGGTESGSGLDTPFHWPAAPTSGASGTYVGVAVAGATLLNTATGDLYVASDATAPTNVSWLPVDNTEA
jgi:hypothetical protein